MCGAREPYGSQHQRDIKMSSEVIPIGEETNGLGRIGHVVKAQGTVFALRHLQKAEHQSKRTKREQKPSEKKPMPEIESNRRKEQRRRNNQGSRCRPGRLRR